MFSVAKPSVNSVEEFFEHFLTIMIAHIGQVLHELFLFLFGEDVFGDAGKNSVPEGAVAIWECFDLGGECIENAVAGHVARNLVEVVKHFHDHFGSALPEHLFESQIELLVFGLEVDFLVVFFCIVLFQHGVIPIEDVHHFDEAVGRFGYFVDLGVGTHLTEIEDFVDFGAAEGNVRIVDEEAFIHSDIVVDEIVVLDVVLQVGVGDGAEGLVELSILVLVFRELRIHGDGHFQQIEKGADGVLLEGLSYRAEQLVEVLFETFLQGSHHHFQKLH